MARQQAANNQDIVPCKNLSLWIAILMTCGWLFILSYMTAVVHTENRRLEIQVQKCKQFYFFSFTLIFSIKIRTKHGKVAYRKINYYF